LQDGTNVYMVQEVGSLREQGRCRGWKL